MEFFIGCIFSNDPLNRQGSPSAHCNAGSASPPQPADTATLRKSQQRQPRQRWSRGHYGPTCVTTAATGSREVCPSLRLTGKPVKAAPVRPRLCTSISVTQPHVSATQVGTHLVRSATTCKRSASTALAGTHHPVGAYPRAGTGPFPKPRALVLPMVNRGQSKRDA